MRNIIDFIIHWRWILRKFAALVLVTMEDRIDFMQNYKQIVQQ